jgi:AMP phosphorylase
MDVSVSITDGFQPIGRGVGPSLEARDVIDVLQGSGPADLKEKSLKISGKIFEMVGKKNGYEFAKKILETGKAYKKFREIIEAQEGNPSVKSGDIPVGEYVVEVPSPQDSNYLYYESSVISQVARLAGAPSIKGAGVELVAPPGSVVKEGKILLRVVTPSKERLPLIEDFLSKNSPLVSRNMVIESF